MDQPMIAIPMEDALLHTREHPYCDDRTCPCHRQGHEDIPSRMAEQAYVTEVLRTYAGTEDQKLCLGALGLTGEAGEVADIVKKHLFQGHAIDQAKLLDEMGDVLWYYMLILQAVGFTIEEAMQANVEKLKRRYPNGFEAERSINRRSPSTQTEGEL